MQGKKIIKPIRGLLNIHQAMLIGTLTPIFMAMVAPIDRSNYTVGSANFNYAQAIVVGAFLILNMVSSFLFKQQLQKLQPLSILSEKIPIYHLASIVKFALLFTVLSMAGLGYLLCKHWSFLTLYCIQFILFFSQRPHPILASGHLGVERDSLYE
jgi:hypothetical protein